jgi:hypothetical protein
MYSAYNNQEYHHSKSVKEGEIFVSDENIEYPAGHRRERDEKMWHS